MREPFPTPISRLLAVVAAAGLIVLAASGPSAAQRQRVKSGGSNTGATQIKTIPTGTIIPVTTDEDITVKKDNVGKTYRGKVTQDVTVNGVAGAIKGGSAAEVRLLADPNNPNQAVLRMTSVTVAGKQRPSTTDAAKQDASKDGGKKVGAGAAAGAVIGAISGDGLVKGALIGAGGGYIWSMTTGGDENKVKKGAKLSFTLKEPIVVK